MGSLAEEAVKQAVELGRRIANALRGKAELGAWLASPDAALGFSLSPELLAFVLPSAPGADADDVGNKIAFLILSSQPSSAVGQLIADVAAKAFRRAGAALHPYLDADDLSSLLRWRLWKLEARYFNPARILKHPGLAAYVSVIARRMVIDEARALGNRSRLPIEATEIETAFDPRATMDAVLDDLDLLRRFAAELPAWQTPVVEVLAGELDRDTALAAINQARATEGLSPWTQESLRTGIHRARSRLRELLEEQP